MDLTTLFMLLACPVGMGLMMWFMMRGSKSAGTTQPPGPDAQVTALRAELDQLHAAQRDASRDRLPEGETR